jgi:hypothetical protein
LGWIIVPVFVTVGRVDFLFRADNRLAPEPPDVRQAKLCPGDVKMSPFTVPFQELVNFDVNDPPTFLKRWGWFMVPILVFAPK